MVSNSITTPSRDNLEFFGPENLTDTSFPNPKQLSLYFFLPLANLSLLQ